MKRTIGHSILSFVFAGIILLTIFAILVSCKKKGNKNPVIPGEDYIDPDPYTNLERGTMTDQDGNEYETIKIGNQWWMKENLRVTHYRDGKEIQRITGETPWSRLTTGAYCNYDNRDDLVATYGRLYNWYAVNDWRNIAPSGWHVPTDGEWQTMVDYLGGKYVAGGEIKEAGYSHWSEPNTGATNESGFTGLPGGRRDGYDGEFGGLGYYANFWSATYNDEWLDFAWLRSLGYHNSDVVGLGDRKEYGHSVRLLRDN